MARFRCSASISLNWGRGVILFLILFCPVGLGHFLLSFRSAAAHDSDTGLTFETLNSIRSKFTEKAY